MAINALRKDGRRPLQIAAILIKQRCYNPKNPGYKSYGGIGVSMWEPWQKDYKMFAQYCIENGWQDGMEIHRKNDSGNYEPGNIIFVTKREHKLLNKRTTANWEIVQKIHSLRNEGKKFREISDIVGVSETVVTNVLTSLHWKDYQPPKSEQGIKVDVNTMAKKLTPQKVREILLKRHKSYSLHALSREYDVQRYTIKKILSGQFWNKIWREFNYIKMLMHPSPRADYAT